jgi:DNA-binding winged helix-turn-helix (wHTH) protein
VRSFLCIRARVFRDQFGAKLRSQLLTVRTPPPTTDRREHREPPVRRFAGFELDLANPTLCRHGQPVALSHKALDVLVFLVARQGELVSRVELQAAIWPNVRVSPGSLTQAVWEIRKAFADAERGTAMIQTARGRGYRFEPPQEPLITDRRCPAASIAFALEDWTGRSLPTRLKRGLMDLDEHSLSTVLELTAFLTRISTPMKLAETHPVAVDASGRPIKEAQASL